MLNNATSKIFNSKKITSMHAVKAIVYFLLK